MRPLLAAASAVLLLTLVPALAGCSGSVSVGDPTVSRRDVEEKVSRGLAAEVGQEPDDVSCPDDLAGKVDQQMRCTLTDGGTELGVTVTVTAVEGTEVDFDFQVDDTPVG